MKQGSAIINDGSIELSFEYDIDTIQLVKDIDGRRWDAPKHPGVWSLPATAWHAEQVCRILPEFYIDPTIKFMAEGEKVKPRIRLPKELYEFQKQGVKYIASVNGRCIVADDMGLGKSAEALIFLRYFSNGKVLIVSPANVTFKWAEVECARWWPGKTVEVITTGKGNLPDVDILVMSYAIMVNRYEELKDIPFQSIILDEAHYCKAPKAQRTKVAKALIHAGIPHALLLSGTPFMNNPGELFYLLNILDPIGFSNFYSYAIKYCGAFKSSGIWVFPKDVVTNREELEGRLKNYMIRRTKQEVELELPELTRTYVPVELGSKGEYKKAVEEFKDWKKQRKNYASALVQLTKLRQIIGREKVDATVELAENILDAGRKVVIFCHHREIVSLLEKSLRKYGVGIIAGETKAEDRQRQADIFLLDTPKMRCIIITVAGAEGINLYSASDIVFAEREYTPAREEQAEARLHRIGQKNNVNAYYVVLKGTIDERMNSIVKRKREVIGQVISQDDIVEEILESI